MKLLKNPLFLLTLLILGYWGYAQYLNHYGVRVANILLPGYRITVRKIPFKPTILTPVMPLAYLTGRTLVQVEDHDKKHLESHSIDYDSFYPKSAAASLSGDLVTIDIEGWIVVYKISTNEFSKGR